MLIIIFAENVNEKLDGDVQIHGVHAQLKYVKSAGHHVVKSFVATVRIIFYL